jgi:DNA-binding XRE family transcriptional regulator
VRALGLDEMQLPPLDVAIERELRLARLRRLIAKRASELTVAIGAVVRALREGHRITQADLAKRLGSSQSRAAKLAAGDRSVSMELLMRALLSLGASKKEVRAMLGKRAA